MSPFIFTLPDEILVQIIRELAPVDIWQCQATCFKLNSVINASSEIQYHIALEIANLEDTGSCSGMTHMEKIDKLKKGQSAWRRWKPQFTRQIAVQHIPNHSYDLSGGIYMLGHRHVPAMEYLALPDCVDDVPEWGRFNASNPILDVGLCIDEHDLVVLVTRQTIESDPPTYEIVLELIESSTGELHPLALHPRISAFKHRHFAPGIGLEIVGNNLVLILSYSPGRHQNIPGSEDRILVFEWATGLLKMSVSAPYQSYSGLLFLNEHLLLLPNAKQGVLEVWDLPRSTTDPSPSAPLYMLELPDLAPGRSFAYISCRAEPNPIGENTRKWQRKDQPLPKRQQRAFKAKPEEAIIIFNVLVEPLQTGPHPIVARGFSHTYTFFVHRKSILQAVTERQCEPRSHRPRIDIDFPSSTALLPTPIPWDRWGPKSTRWIDADDVPTTWITTTSGERAVLISEAAGNIQGSGSPIVVMDFNQTRVKKGAYEIRQKQRVALEREERRRKLVASRLDMENVVRRYQECKAWVDKVEAQLGEIQATAAGAAAGTELSEPPDVAAAKALNWPDLDSANLDQVRVFLEQHMDLMQQLQSASSFADEMEVPSTPSLEDDSDSDSDAGSSGPGATRSIKRPRVWCLNTPQAVDRAGACFLSPVVSELPCLGYTSKDHYHFDGVLVDDERILGITTDHLNGKRVNKVDVLYFG